jgi:hypothetical protein
LDEPERRLVLRDQLADEIDERSTIQPVEVRVQHLALVVADERTRFGAEHGQANGHHMLAEVPVAVVRAAAFAVECMAKPCEPDGVYALGLDRRHRLLAT